MLPPAETLTVVLYPSRIVQVCTCGYEGEALPYDDDTDVCPVCGATDPEVVDNSEPWDKD